MHLSESYYEKYVGNIMTEQHYSMYKIILSLGIFPRASLRGALEQKPS